MTNKEAIEHLKWMIDYDYNDDMDAVELAIKALENERPKGEWIVKTQSTFPQYQPNEYECPFCHTVVNHKTNFCHHCGAEMEVTNETQMD